MLFPEGERSIDRDVKAFKKGAAILASNIGTPVVPIAISGAHDLWPRKGSLRLWRLLPFVGQVRMAFGKPIEFDAYDPAMPPDYVGRTEKLRDEVEQLMAGLR
jgi:1-acyl-sn-glycerol-3-phosphate acyltransferase